MVGLSTDAAGWRATDAASDSDSDMAGGPGGGEAEDNLSPEDAAWVDSCLVKDDDPHHGGGEGNGDYFLSDDAWAAALTEAFVTALASSASGTATAIQDQEKVDESSTSMDAGREASRANASGDELMSQAAADGLFQADALIEEPSSPTASTYAATFYDQPSPTLGDCDSSGDGPSTVAAQFQGTAEGSSNGHLDAAAAVIGNEYPEGQGYGPYGEGDDELSIAADEEVGEVELTAGDVFRVWELDVPDEEEDGDEEGFGWQLKKALEGSSVGAVIPPVAEDGIGSTTILDDWKMHHGKPSAVLDDQNLEELIAGIDGMSLGRPPSSDC